jgi:CRISPR-associated protein Csb2
VDPAKTVWVRLHETRERRFERDQTRTPLVRPGFHLLIEFDAPVTGPIIVGDSSHFGLGQFRSLGRG